MASYKIFTYADPFKLTESSFWEEIKDYPHLCSSRALVTGLSCHYGRDFVPCLCTIEDVTERVYPQWVNGIELQVEQLVHLSGAIEGLSVDDRMKKTFKFNKRDLLKAVRFLQEMNICYADMELQDLSAVERGFLELYEYLLREHRQSFVMQEKCSLNNYKAALVDFLDHEASEREKVINEKKYLLNDLKATVPIDFDLRKYKRALRKQENILKRLQNKAAEWGRESPAESGCLKKVVFHGLHLFNPLRVKLIQELALQGTEIVFLHNYLSDYPGIYETWDRVYSWNDILPVRDETNKSYRKGPFEYEGSDASFGKVMAGLLTGDFSMENEVVTDFYEYPNNTSFAYYAGELYEKSKREKADLYQMEKYHGGKMGEYIYSANYRPVNDIIRMYYPELYGDRHFLSYPVGQFILSLYRMWDEDKNDLMMEPRLLKECFNTSLFLEEPEKMSSLFQKIELFFQDISSGRDYSGRIDNLIANLELIEDKDSEAPGFRDDLKGFSFYSCNKEEILLFKENIKRLKDLAEELFGEKTVNKIDFKRHFEKLISLIREEREENEGLNEQERELIDSLMERFDNLDRLAISGSLEDIKESIYYYLKQKESGEEAEYLVGNFEQIEGGVLLSEVAGKDKRYHFAGLSEMNMKVDNREHFPWPLSESFFINGFNNENLTLKIVLQSMKEYRNFLRYAFFFGVFFTKRPFSLSFIKNEGDREQEPWFLLNLMGLKAEKYDEGKKFLSEIKLPGQNFRKKPQALKKFEFDKIDCQNYVFCPRRFVFDRLLGGGSPYYNEYFCSQLYRNILYETVWQKIGGKALVPYLLTENIAEVEAELRTFFPFWKQNVDFADSRNRVMDDMIADFRMREDKRFPDYDESTKSYFEIKKNFILAQIKDQKNANKLIELHRLRVDKPNALFRKQTEEGLRNLMNIDQMAEHTVDDRCAFCKEREACLESYKPADNI